MSASERQVVFFIAGHYTQQSLSRQEMCLQYNRLLVFLHRKSFPPVTSEELSDIFIAPGELLVFLCEDNTLIATAHATLVQAPPIYQVLINNVIVVPDKSRLGYGQLLMERLLEEIKVRWGTERSKRILLTNSPKKRNAGFYSKLGFRPRTAASGDETVVWVKEV